MIPEDLAEFEYRIASAEEVRGWKLNFTRMGLNTKKLLIWRNRPSFEEVSDSVPAHRKFVGVP